MQRAILSVYRKEGLERLAVVLQKLNFEILASSGTANYLKEKGFEVKEVSDFTNEKEMLQGRIKTLSNKLFAGILYKRGNEQHEKSANPFKIDLIAVNFYPFEENADKNKELSEMQELIDIGGPSLVRAGAKNFESVIVITNEKQYAEIAEIFEKYGEIAKEKRLELAIQALEVVAAYDISIAKYFQKQRKRLNEFQENLFLHLTKQKDLRYGENPHQRAAVYSENKKLNAIQQLQGKELSYNNYLDIEAAMQLLYEFKNEEKPFSAIFKHANPSGAAISQKLSSAFQNSYSADPLSAYGGIVALNRTVDEETAELIVKYFLEIVVATSYESEALEIFSKKKSLRVIKLENFVHVQPFSEDYLKSIPNCYLLQNPDINNSDEEIEKGKVVTKRGMKKEEITAGRLAWKVCKIAKSNAVVYASGEMCLAIGTGQQSRIDACIIAVIKAERAKLSLKDSVLASDAFLPFRDVVDFSAEKGCSSIIQPGGSIRDNEIISAADEHDMAMLFTGKRHFRH